MIKIKIALDGVRTHDLPIWPQLSLFRNNDNDKIETNNETHVLGILNYIPYEL